MPRSYAIGEFAAELGVHPAVKRWCRSGDLDYTRTPGGDRRIPHRELLRLAGDDRPRDHVALYARVSSHGQKDNGWTVETTYTDIGSGLTEDRRGLNTLLDETPEADFGRLLVTDEDRLTRFGFSYLEGLLDHHGVTITVIEDGTDKTAQEELDDHALYRSIHGEEPPEDFELYLPSRIRRCILQKIGETLRSHADRREAFQAIQHLLPSHKVRRIHRRRIKEELWDGGEYLSSGYVDSLVDQLNTYYDRHGRYPDTYFELQDPPEYSNGTLPYSADDGPTSGQAVKYRYDEGERSVTVKMKTPDTVTPESRGEWSWHEHELDGYDAFHTLTTHGSLSAPEFQSSTRKNGDQIYELSFPVSVDTADADGDAERVLALDAGMRKDVTAVVVDEDGEQVSRPHFVLDRTHLQVTGPR